MSPHKTGIEETEASFKKGKLITLREQILYTYHNAEQIDEKLAFILLRIADTIDKLDPEAIDEIISNLENRLAKLDPEVVDVAINNLEKHILRLEEKPAPTEEKKKA